MSTINKSVGPQKLGSAVPEPGQQLRRAREKLRLKYRDVEQASSQIANRNRNQEFFVGLSRLADIENRGTVPSIYRLYSLCAIYGLDLSTVLAWYGVDIQKLTADAAMATQGHSRLLELMSENTAEIEIPELSNSVDLRETTYISREILRWGTLPSKLVRSLDLQRKKYGFLGTDDWSMYPILTPGSFLQIDETKTKIAQEMWTHEIERPIYFLERRDGFRCGWCTLAGESLIVQPHWSSQNPLEVFSYPGEIEIVGQIVGVAMRLGVGKRRHIRFSADRG
jgi:transcriptional regulator with XRE-family HTH domain